MSVKNLNKQSETDWDRVDALTDDEIDISDIPPLNDEFFENATVFLPRAYVDRLDLIEAQKFGTFILENCGNTSTDRIVVEALGLALIISYTRPFSSRYDLKEQKEFPLDKKLADVLSDEAEIALHERIKQMRNQSFAHSDARSHLFSNSYYRSRLAPIFKSELPLPISEVKELLKMIQKWIEYLDREIARGRTPSEHSEE